MIYPIVLYGDPVLRKPTEDVEPGTDLRLLIQDMYETMKHAQGIGLAAPQIGKSIRLFVVDGTVLEDEPSMEDFRQAFINPLIVEELGENWEYEEGCLSIPNIRESVSRREKLRIRYYDEDWNEKEEDFYGLKARIIQHEYDHIEGKLF
ncbi:MAG TPA: peptide deformylase, partial [Cyclobacteriaceae bacterium]|nr:peptide deformylase [Cyclobacteriaceae bacterium]